MAFAFKMCLNTLVPGEGRDLEDDYLALQKRMQRMHMPDLQRVDRLCTYLNILQPDNGAVQKLRAMQVKHIRPLIAQIKVWSSIPASP